MTSTADKAAFLKKVPLFKGLTTKQLSAIAERMVERTYKAGDVVIQQGKGGEGFFIVSAGKLEAILEHRDGETSVVNTFAPTDFFGELALLSEGTRTASIVAIDDSTCQVLTRWDFRALLANDAEMAISILEELSSRFRQVLSTI